MRDSGIALPAALGPQGSYRGPVARPARMGLLFRGANPRVFSPLQRRSQAQAQTSSPAHRPRR
jgi:hypothetical protein